MKLETLLDELEPLSLEDAAATAEARSSEPLFDSLSHMLRLAERIAKTGYRASQSTELVGEQVTDISEFMEDEVEARKADLRIARAEIGDLAEVRDRLARALMETADLSASAADAAHRDLDEEVGARFDRLQSHIDRVLRRAGMEGVAEEGERFDPEFHEAVDRVDSDSAESRTILEVVRQGYRLRGETMRIARVVIAE